MDKRARTLEAIERKRREMIEASSRYGLSSKEVLMKSQELDVLLNRYQRIQENQFRVS
ncbi:aspartyl-phosphate phosphatase Spo0E family protein [Paenibacillus alkaliterrae]|uniref:aspartyl-phosphate phosphatase Spo0E family protein n=1 Tax=Paenibacillus alkaliterrae TaxID=320909 RepID=UPI0022868A64|nr:aspartyl-phosphate phosphatase Spo0E family protein [Paenibacillus alkaliterrae]